MRWCPSASGARPSARSARRIREAYLRDCLQACGALAIVLPELDALLAYRSRPLAPGSGRCVRACSQATPRAGASVRFAALAASQARRRASCWPQPWASGCVSPIEPIASPRGSIATRAAAARQPRVHAPSSSSAPPMLELLEAADAFRRPERFHKLLQACEAGARGAPAERERYPARAADLAAALAAASARSADRRARRLAGARSGMPRDRRSAAIMRASSSAGKRFTARAADPEARSPQRQLERARQRHHLERLAHLPRQQQRARLARQAARAPAGLAAAATSASMPMASRNAACVQKPATSSPASAAASATRVKSTQAVMSCMPGYSSGSLVRAVAEVTAHRAAAALGW